MDLHHNSLLRAAESAAVRAGAALSERLLQGGVELRAKTSAYDVVTEADVAAEAVIRQTLRESFPASAVLGEEEGGDDVGGAGIRWIVDPIDGTHNFARSLPLFCVSIGIELAGQIVGGCVFDPVRGELYTAMQGEFRLNGRPVATRAAAPEVMPLVLTDIPSAGVRDPAELALFMALLDVSDVRRIGSSALALAAVAAGRADLAVNADAYIWDIAAGSALVTAAGGGFVAVPEDPRTEQPGGFVAWRPGFEELGRRTAAALGGLTALRG